MPYPILDARRYLSRLISEGEHQQQDFKYRVEDAVKLARSVSAFANTDGGRLLIGVRDDGVMSGVRSEEEIYVMQRAAWRQCQPEASIRFDTYHVEGRTIVIATVPRSDNRPVCAIDEQGRQRAYIRINDENIIASPVHLRIWRDEQSPRGAAFTYGTDERTLLATLGAAPDGMTLNSITRTSKLPRHRVTELLARFIRYGIAAWRMENHTFLFSAAR